MPAGRGILVTFPAAPAPRPGDLVFGPGQLPGGMPVTPVDRVRAILLDDYTLTNGEVALLAQSTKAQVKAVRHHLVSIGLIPPSRIVPAQAPRFKPLPSPPRALMQGACVGHPDADAWHSDNPARRELAKNLCRWACPVQAACLEWSLSLPTEDRTIYAATSGDDRRRLRAQRAGRPAPIWLSSQSRNAARDRRRAAARQARERQAEASGGAA